jgi:hypothetical protein
MKERKSDKPLIKLSDKFWEVLEQLKEHSITYAIAELEMNPLAINTMRVQEIDVADKEYRLNVKIADKFIPMKISAFMRNFFGNQYDQEEIDEFTTDYNKIIKGASTKQSVGKRIDVGRFKFNPKDIRSTFLSLVTETYPHGHEEEVVDLITPGLTKDDYGNYYTIIGDSDTVFTCHLDTASRTKNPVTLISYEKGGEEYIVTDGKSILGADDKAGVTVLMYMIAHNIPGVYWFFIGEERGGLGSRHVSNNIQNYPFMAGKTKCVSFDRRNYHSVITQQMGVQCCSNEFAKEICDEMSKSGLKLSIDPTGVFTDSANFIEQINECTNISVGYFNEHTHTEMQNMTYLINLCEAAISCDWKNLKTHRKLAEESESYKKYRNIARLLKRTTFYNYDVIRTEEDKFIIEIEVSDVNPEHLKSDLVKLQNLLYSNKLHPNLTFGGTKIKVELD